MYNFYLDRSSNCIVLRRSSSSANAPSSFLVTSDNTKETNPKKSPPLTRSSLDLIDILTIFECLFTFFFSNGARFESILVLSNENL